MPPWWCFSVASSSFIGLLNDLFPGVDPPRVVDISLARCITKATEDSGLWPDQQFTLKVAQLDELLAIRHCVFVMGPAGAGKSACWKTLSRARGNKEPQRKVRVAHLNPKVLPTEDLYGHIALQSREWKDGLLSSIMRDLGQIEDDKPKWYVRPLPPLSTHAQANFIKLTPLSSGSSSTVGHRIPRLCFTPKFTA